ncbi:hypothetical protein FQR65_LT13568 [Abscondita terminalis]|nr:hypothetical protein FQR65_LT13568 [Abscondita terminalis]
MSRCCYSDDMTGVAFPTPNQCGSHRHRHQKCVTVFLLCGTFAFIASYFYYGFSEIQCELSSLRKDFSPMGALGKCGKKSEGKYGGGGGADSDDIKAIVQAALRDYDADKTTRADFALESAGGAIVSTGDTEPFETGARTGSLFGIPICQSSNGPRQIIQVKKNNRRDLVLCLENVGLSKGSRGSAVIKLLGLVTVDGVSLEHISKSISPTGLIDTAPQCFSIWGLDCRCDQECECDAGELLGDFVYDINGPPLQTFDITNPNSKSFKYIEFKVDSNHGNHIFTCVYRLRVHGQLDTSKKECN